MFTKGAFHKITRFSNLCAIFKTSAENGAQSYSAKYEITEFEPTTPSATPFLFATTKRREGWCERFHWSLDNHLSLAKHERNIVLRHQSNYAIESSSCAFEQESASNGQSGVLDDGCGLQKVIHLAQQLFSERCSMGPLLLSFFLFGKEGGGLQLSGVSQSFY